MNGNGKREEAEERKHKISERGSSVLVKRGVP